MHVAIQLLFPEQVGCPLVECTWLVIVVSAIQPFEYFHDISVYCVEKFRCGNLVFKTSAEDEPNIIWHIVADDLLELFSVEVLQEPEDQGFLVIMVEDRNRMAVCIPDADADDFATIPWDKICGLYIQDTFPVFIIARRTRLKTH